MGADPPAVRPAVDRTGTGDRRTPVSRLLAVPALGLLACAAAIWAWTALPHAAALGVGVGLLVGAERSGDAVGRRTARGQASEAMNGPPMPCRKCGHEHPGYAACVPSEIPPPKQRSIEEIEADDAEAKALRTYNDRRKGKP